MAVHDGVVTESELLAWVRAAACSELGLPAGAFEPPSPRDAPYPTDHGLRSFRGGTRGTGVPPAFDGVNG